MDNNFKLYRSVQHIIEAAKYLRELDDKVHDQLLDMGEDILEKIEIDEEEIKKIEEYERRIKEKIKQ
jgi:hypothetical protein